MDSSERPVDTRGPMRRYGDPVRVAGDVPGQETSLYRRSLASQIAQRVRADILLGRLRPGEKVSQQQLAQTYGTSRIPVRDALRELTQEGFLVSGPGGQVVVTRLTADDITDTFSILATALSCAIRHATAAATPDDVARLRSIHRRMVDTAADGSSSSAFGELNWELHRQINLLGSSEKLRATIRSISASIPVAYSEFPLRPAEVAAEKEVILDALERGDADVAAGLMQEHVVRMGAGLLEYLRAHEILDA
jgi:DNA-binding GntR family transcriptional regulator